MAQEAETLIELSELKIGNYLLYKGEVVHITSLSLDIDDEYEDQIGFCKLGSISNEFAAWNRSLYNDLERIPLTSDFLDRLEFRKFADDSYHKPAMLTWRVLYDDYEKAASYCTCIYPELGHRVHLNVRIEFLHQLQNIYFAMTGEELKTKRKMIQPKLFAQLGNQCFMISAAIAHALKMGTSYSIPKKTISPNIWRTYFSHLPETKSATLHYYKEKRHCYDPLPEVDSLTIEGYFQTEKYWHGYKEQIAEVLGFVHKPEPYVAVHIRRGDYLKYPDQFPVMPVEYYYKAIKHFADAGFYTFKIYSDDIAWCKKAFDATTLLYSENKDPLTDMKDMYNASAFIIGNSTFSLFPALLRGDNPTVIAPDENHWPWCGPNGSEAFDLMPERFIKINANELVRTSI